MGCASSQPRPDEASAEACSGKPQHRERQGCSTGEEREAKQCASVGGSQAQVADPAGDSQAALVVTPCTSESAAPRNESTQVLPPVSQLCGGAACWDPVDEERQRLAVVARLATTPPGDRFAPITALLKTVFGAPLACVTLVMQHEVLSDFVDPAKWTGHRVGDTVCEWVLKQPRPEMIIVDDLSKDPRFCDISMVAQEPHLRFYASAPLVSTDGRALRYGTLCVLDYVPRSFPPSQYQLLAHFASLAVSELERDMEVARGELALREAQKEAQAAAELRGLTCGFEASTEAVLVLQVAEAGWPVVYANPAAQALLGALPIEVPFWQLFAPADSHRGRSGQERLAALPSAGRPFALACRRRRGGGAASLDGADSEALPPLSLRASLDSTALPRFASLPAGGLSEAGALGSGDCDSLNTGASGRVSAGAGAVLAVTFSPGSATPAPCGPGAGAGAPPVAIPLTAGEQEGPAAAAAAASAPPPPYWFATLRPTNDSARLEMLGFSGTQGTPERAHSAASALAAASSAASPIEHMMRPEAMRDIALGPLLGVGASGRTYRGTWQGSAVAVKVMEVKGTPTISDDGDYGGALSGVSSFLGTTSGGANGLSGSGASNGPLVEALLSKALSHPHIVPTHAYGVLDRGGEGEERWQEWWIVQELCTKGTLAKAIEAGVFRNTVTGGPNLSFVLRTAVEIAGALAYLHSHGVLHGDLTGNNVLLNASMKDRRKFVAMIADFGLSRPLDVMSTLDTGTYGTVSHMPPELIMDGQLTSAADCFSFGVVLWEMLAGQRAWARMNALQIVNAVTVLGRSLQPDEAWPPPLQDLVRRCLSPDPAARPTAKQLLGELQALLDRASQAARTLAAAAGADAPAEG